MRKIFGVLVIIIGSGMAGYSGYMIYDYMAALSSGTIKFNEPIHTDTPFTSDVVEIHDPGIHMLELRVDMSCPSFTKRKSITSDDVDYYPQFSFPMTLSIHTPAEKEIVSINDAFSDDTATHKYFMSSSFSTSKGYKKLKFRTPLHKFESPAGEKYIVGLLLESDGVYDAVMKEASIVFRENIREAKIISMILGILGALFGAALIVLGFIIAMRRNKLVY